MQNTGYTDYRFSLGNSDFMFFIDTLPVFYANKQSEAENIHTNTLNFFMLVNVI